MHHHHGLFALFGGRPAPRIDGRIGRAPRIEPTLAIETTHASPVDSSGSATPLAPLSSDERSGNEIRPETLAEMVGQERLKPLLRELIDRAITSDRPLDHMLLVGASGTGKTTVSHVVATELGRRVYQVDAPVSQEMLEELRAVMRDGDILFVDEIHRQVAADRRGATAACQPEVFYAVLEDRRLLTARGIEPFPAITVIGATTDAGLLPEPFLARFPLRPMLDRYTVDEMTELARRNAATLGVPINEEGALVLARASRCNPRQLQNYVRNARALTPSIDRQTAERIVVDLNSTALDGLTGNMQAMLRFLLKSRRDTRAGTVYQASVNTIATALGLSRDSKAVVLYVEPWLIEQGYVQVTHGGRQLTDAGIERALQQEER